MSYKEKYLKYKSKYLNLKEIINDQIAGDSDIMNIDNLTDTPTLSETENYAGFDKQISNLVDNLPSNSDQLPDQLPNTPNYTETEQMNNTATNKLESNLLVKQMGGDEEEPEAIGGGSKFYKKQPKITTDSDFDSYNSDFSLFSSLGSSSDSDL